MPRIIAGTARGIRLSTPKGLETRPTADGRKEAIFSSIQFEIPESRFLDLFAGCGAAGLEALSRGAAEAVFVESGREAASCIRENMRRTRLTGRIFAEDVLAALDRLAAEGSRFDIVFMDPPYHQGYEALVTQALARLDLVADGGLVVIESAADTEVEVPEGFREVRCKQYRVTKFTMWRKNRGEET